MLKRNTKRNTRMRANDSTCEAILTQLAVLLCEDSRMCVKNVIVQLKKKLSSCWVVEKKFVFSFHPFLSKVESVLQYGTYCTFCLWCCALKWTIIFKCCVLNPTTLYSSKSSKMSLVAFGRKTRLLKISKGLNSGAFFSVLRGKMSCSFLEREIGEHYASYFAILFLLPNDERSCLYSGFFCCFFYAYR